MNIIEKILAKHANKPEVKPDEIIDVFIDTRAARDFGGANVVKNLLDNGLTLADPKRTVFTFDCNPGGSDQKYAQNQQYLIPFQNNLFLLCLIYLQDSPSQSPTSYSLHHKINCLPHRSLIHLN